MTEEFDNYQSMLDEVHQWAARHDEPLTQELEGVVTAEDVAAVEATIREGMDLLLMRFEELHARVWRMEERLSRLESASEGEVDRA